MNSPTWITSMKDIANDWRRERRIKRLSREAKAAFLDGHKSLSRALFAEMAAEIHQRSARQIRRLERKRGLPHA